MITELINTTGIHWKVLKRQVRMAAMIEVLFAFGDHAQNLVRFHDVTAN